MGVKLVRHGKSFYEKGNKKMDEKEFINKMDNLKKPGFEDNSPNNMLKFAIVNSKKSAAMGVWFLAVPLYFLLKNKAYD